MNKKMIARYVIREILAVAGMGAVLFLAAGSIAWWQAWAAIAVVLAWVAATDIVVLRLEPDLLPERMGRRPGSKSWDTAILSILNLTGLARYIVAGLDHRYGWTDDFPLPVQMAALAVCVLGYALFIRALASNAFFSQIVRIQSDRGHAVATGGPYRYVRHPAYCGAILFELAVPILLTSWWAFIAGGASVILLVLRTALEDRTLQAELAGYADYARRVRHRLVPGIW